MILKNIKANKDRGFTIVELLVVIVVIGILAAITIVSYTGITARANTSANQQNASSIIASAQTFYADNSKFPNTDATSANVYTNFSGGLGNVGKLPGGLTITSATLLSTTTTALSYRVKGTSPNFTGVCVGYWDFSVPGVKYLFAGDATQDVSGTCS